MNKLEIDDNFKNLIAPLTPEEYNQLERNILSNGCKEPITIWNEVIIDGHNRYKICTENNIPFQTVSMNFSNRSEVIVWILKHQLCRHHLTNFQRNEMSLKYEKMIAEYMKQRMSDGGGDKKSKKAKTEYDQMNHTDFKPTTKRKELAKIAGTSEGSIRRSKLILEKGTPEQIDRARKGGKGNSITAIANEIKAKHKLKTETAIEQQENIKPKNEKYTRDYSDPLYDTNREVVRTMDMFVEEFKINFDDAIDLLGSIIRNYQKVLSTDENQNKLELMLKESAERIRQMKGDF